MCLSEGILDCFEALEPANAETQLHRVTPSRKEVDRLVALPPGKPSLGLGVLGCRLLVRDLRLEV